MDFIRLLLRMVFRMLAIFAVFAIILMILFNWPVSTRNEHMRFGVTYSYIFARDLGLDWKEAYIAVLDDLKVKRIRIPAYWTEIEHEKGQYDFSNLDWQLDEARKRNVEVILSMGVKVPRWPECFIPTFYGGSPNEQALIWDKLSDQEEKTIKMEREDALMKYEEQIINRYKGYENIRVWQVENEPFLPFGHCVEGAVDGKLVDREIAQVRSLDQSRNIMVTDSGELSIWYPAYRRSDIFGTTMYRIIHKPPFGYIKYPLGPNFFRIKAALNEFYTNKTEVIVAELQAEPWGPGWLPTLTIEEQYKSMNPQKFREIIDYAKRTGFSDSYLWGAEWWYWLKVKQGNEEMWQEARQLIQDTK